MKKCLSVLLLLMLLGLFGQPIAYGEEAASMDHMIQKLTLLGIVKEQGQQEELQLEAHMTRAEFTAVIIRCLGMDDVAGTIKTSDFYDVNAQYWAVGSIALAAQFGIIDGVADHRFAPEDPLKYEEAIKMLVVTLGYDVVAQKNGGYPMGYLNTAASKGILKNIKVEVGKLITRRDVFQFIYHSLEIDMLKQRFPNSEGGYEIVRGETFLSARLAYLNSIYVRGVVEEVYQTALDGKAGGKKHQMVIDGVVYDAAEIKNDMEFLGFQVELIAEVSSDMPRITAIKKSVNKGNVLLEIDASKLLSVNGAEVSYEGETRNEAVPMSEYFSVIYNGRALSHYAYEQLIPEQGSVKLLDNNGDGDMEVMMIEAYQSFVVKEVDTQRETIYFEEGQLNRRSNLKLDSSDKELIASIADQRGEALEIDQIKPGDVITVFASEDFKVVNVVVSTETTEGKITEVSDEGVIIADALYRPVKNIEAVATELIPGLEGVFQLDVYGNITGVKQRNDLWRYGYIAATNLASAGIDSEIQLKLLYPGSLTALEHDTGDPPSVEVGNQKLEIITACAEIRVNQKKGSADSFFKSGMLHVGDVIKFRTNSEGKLSRVELPRLQSEKGERLFNSRVNLFGGSTGGAFLMDNATNVFCIPDNGSEASTEDYMVRLILENAAKLEVEAYDSREGKRMADVVLIYAKMDAAAPGIISKGTPIAVVEKIGEVIDGDGETVMKISGYCDGERIEEEASSSIGSDHVIHKLSAGDVIQYAKNPQGKIDRVKRLESLLPLPEPYRRGNRGEEEQIFGKAASVTEEMVYSTSVDLLTELTIFTDSANLQTVTYYITSSDQPDVYVFDQNKQIFRPGSIKDIASSDDYGTSNASDVFLSIRDNEVKTIIVIE